MGFCPKKYIPSAKTLYKVDLSNINFNYLCVDSSNDLSYFLNHKSFFTTQLLCIFLAQTLHSFYKSSPSNCKFSEIPLLILIHQIPDVIFEIKSQFFFKVWMFSQCQERSFFLYFLGCMSYWQKQYIKVQISPLLALKFTKFLMSFLEPRISFCSNFVSLFNVMRHNSSVLFHLNICMFWTNGSNQSTNF